MIARAISHASSPKQVDDIRAARIRILGPMAIDFPGRAGQHLGVFTYTGLSRDGRGDCALADRRPQPRERDLQSHRQTLISR
jgi:glutamate synthase domain-containing protein 3